MDYDFILHGINVPVTWFLCTIIPVFLPIGTLKKLVYHLSDVMHCSVCRHRHACEDLQGYHPSRHKRIITKKNALSSCLPSVSFPLPPYLPFVLASPFPLSILFLRMLPTVQTAARSNLAVSAPSILFFYNDMYYCIFLY